MRDYVITPHFIMQSYVFKYSHTPDIPDNASVFLQEFYILFLHI